MRSLIVIPALLLQFGAQAAAPVSAPIVKMDSMCFGDSRWDDRAVEGDHVIVTAHLNFGYQLVTCERVAGEPALVIRRRSFKRDHRIHAPLEAMDAGFYLADFIPASVRENQKQLSDECEAQFRVDAELARKYQWHADFGVEPSECAELRANLY